MCRAQSIIHATGGPPRHTIYVINKAGVELAHLLIISTSRFPFDGSPLSANAHPIYGITTQDGS